MSHIFLVFPHQLFKVPLPAPTRIVYMVEEYLFFSQYTFHKQKLAYHRASMQYYQHYLQKQQYEVHYIEAQQTLHDVRILIPHLASIGCKHISLFHPEDEWLLKRIQKQAALHQLQLTLYPSPQFINTHHELQAYSQRYKRLFQTDFYIWQRKKRQVMVTNDKPEGGKWSFDAENRLKYPKNAMPPQVSFPASTIYDAEAHHYVQTFYAQNPGTVHTTFRYPCTHQTAHQWLMDFLENRFYHFGPYEDAIVRNQHILHHSVLTPALNTGLITPDEIIKTTLAFTHQNEIPLASVEGFIRQIMGWREFIRLVYQQKGNIQRTTNYWNFTRSIPSSWYSGNTGIEPVDQTIKKVLKTGYCHHIERLMILGNFMLLCEFNPDEVYRWFMELFIDAYDWVMVPNVYGMSQFADGGMMCTKPYISGSNYILKMSDYSKGEWTVTWDALFWRFMHVHRSFFTQNPRLGMLLSQFDKLPLAKQQTYIHTAQTYLDSIS